MSDSHVRAVIEQMQAPAHVKLTMCVLAMHANASLECWPSHQRIGDLTGVSSRQAIRNVDELRRLGLLEKMGRRGRGGQFGPNVYRLRLDHLTQMSTDTQDNPADTDVTHQLTRREALSDMGVSGSPIEAIRGTKERQTVRDAGGRPSTPSEERVCANCGSRVIPGTVPKGSKPSPWWECPKCAGLPYAQTIPALSAEAVASNA